MAPLGNFAGRDEFSPAFPVDKQVGIGSGDQCVPGALVKERFLGQLRDLLEVRAPFDLGSNPVPAVALVQVRDEGNVPP